MEKNHLLLLQQQNRIRSVPWALSSLETPTVPCPTDPQEMDKRLNLANGALDL